MRNNTVLDPDLLDALEGIEPAPFVGVAWRVTWASRDPLAGGTGGGRWNPANDFVALYLSLEQDGALAEVYHHLSRAPVFSSSSVKINKIKLRAEQIIRFDNITALNAVGLEEESFRRGVYHRSQAIGAAARFLDFEGLIVPSARWSCLNLVLFPDRLADLDALQLVEARDINWPAWREKTKTRG